MKHVPLSGGGFVVVDDGDYATVAGARWYLMAGRYAASRIRGEKVTMHRLLTGAARGMDVDHIDGNGLNNQRANLRVCRHAENMRNRHGAGNGASRFRGVSVDRRRNKWRAYLTIDYRYIHLGYFESEEDAARAYDRGALAQYGEFAVPNFAAPVAAVGG